MSIRIMIIPIMVLLAAFCLAVNPIIKTFYATDSGSIVAEMLRYSERQAKIDEMVEADLDGNGSKVRVRILSCIVIKAKAYGVWPDWGHVIGTLNITFYGKDAKPAEELYFEEKPKADLYGFDSFKVVDLNNDGKEEIVLLNKNYVMIVFRNGISYMTKPFKCRKAKIEYDNNDRKFDILSEDGAKYRWSPPQLFEDGFERIN